MTVSKESPQFSTEVIFDFLEKRLGVVSLGVIGFLAVIVVNSTKYFYYPTLFFIIALSTSLPAIFTENKWLQIKNKTKDMRVEYNKIMKHRVDFITGGILFSAIMIPTSLILYNLITTPIMTDISRGSTMNNLNISRLRIFLIILAIVLFFISQIPFNITEENPTKRDFDLYLKSPFTLLTLISYFIIGSYFSVLILWYLSSTNLLSDPGGESLFAFQTNQFSGALPLMIIIPAFVVIVLSFNVTQTPYFKDNFKTYFPKDRKTIELIGINLAIIWLTSFLIRNAYITDTRGNSLLYQILTTTILIFIGGFIYLTSRSLNIDKTCNKCGFIHSEENCPFCDMPEDILPITLGFDDKVKHPKCPNCNEDWNNMSRRCSNCDFTIVLSCQNCAQTVNPLWKKCDRCGEPRKPVPEVALSNPKMKQFTQTRSVYILMVVFLIPIILIQFAILNYYDTVRSFFETEGLDTSLVDKLQRDDSIRLYFLLFLTIILLISIIRGSKKFRQPFSVFIGQIHFASLATFNIYLLVLVVIIFNPFISNFSNLSLFLLLLQILTFAIFVCIVYLLLKRRINAYLDFNVNISENQNVKGGF